MYSCNTCNRQHLPCNEGRWGCEKCKYDVCIACRPMEEIALDKEMALKPPMELLQCFKGHSLKITDSALDYPNGKFYCQNCTEEYPCADKRWACIQCKYDVCFKCRPISKSLRALPQFLQCLKSHGLVWSRDKKDFKETKYMCEVCQKEYACSNGRWCCNLCLYDVCHNCRRNKPCNLIDDQKHPLVWSSISEGYTAKKYGCKGCQKTGICREGRWNCYDCKYDICGDCSSPNGLVTMHSEKYNDKDGNTLNWTVEEDEKSANYTCARCSKTNPTKNGRWYCKKSNYSVCPSCLPPFAKFTSCNVPKHQLQYLKDYETDPEEEFKCVICSAKKKSVEGRWKCVPCRNYNVCNDCRPITSPTIIEPLSECEQQHPLKISTDIKGYEKGQYECSLCKRIGDCGTGRWGCVEGKYNICPTCRTYDEQSAEVVEKAIVRSGTDILECPKNHLLMISTTENGYKTRKYQCKSCSQNFPCSQARWNCEACAFDICCQCRPPITSPISVYSSTTQCSEGHPLEFSNQIEEDEDPEDQYNCRLCNGKGSKQKGRYLCKICSDYEICSSCRASPFDKDPKNHGLLWTNDTEGYARGKYKCQICNKEKLCFAGRWGCEKCKYDICTDCKPVSGSLIHYPTSIEDEKEHLLDPCFDLEDNGDNKFKCNECKNIALTRDGRLRCRECQISICRNCKKLPIDYVKECKSNSPLIWSRSKKGYPSGTFLCDTCKLQKGCEEGRWCPQEEDNKYNVCASCRPPLGTSSISPYIECKNNHPLEWSEEEFSGSSFTCRICKRRRPSKLGRWCCVQDRYEICNVCRPLDNPINEIAEEANEKSRKPATNLVHCPDGHLLRAKRSEGDRYPNKIYRCMSCNNFNNTSDIRYTCDTCYYNICPACKPVGHTAVLPFYISCKSGHTLAWVASKDKSEKYSCYNCKQTKLAKDGRWNCKSCNYNICSTCRPSKQQEFKDAMNHPLKWSNYGIGKGKKFVCALCKKVKSTSQGRWYCQPCNYFVCGTCKAPLGSMVLLEKNAHQPDHYMSWAYDVDDIGKYTCQKCKKEGESKFGRWSCASCKYELCGECKLPVSAYSTDEKMHQLLWSYNSKGYKGKKYLCRGCKKKKACTLGRWSCNSCKVDVCPSCRPPVS